MKMKIDIKAMREAQDNPNWKFVGGTTIRRQTQGLGDQLVRDLGGPEQPPETFMIGTTHFTYEQFAEKWLCAISTEYVETVKPLISKPEQLGYVLVHEGERLENTEAWNQPQWYPKGFVEVTYRAL